MGKETKIEWCDHTFNPWRGCARVDEGCRHCYAETWSKRNPKTLGVWGLGGVRVVTSENSWRDPVKWNKTAAKEGIRRRVFCASMADVFEDHTAVIEARERLWKMIKQTPALDWLLLSKRPENFARMLPADWGAGYPNAWLGTSISEQQSADKRIPILLETPSLIRFISAEPLLDAVALGQWLDRLDWVIIGGESGHYARLMDPEWAEDLIAECRVFQVKCFFKQKGEWLARRWRCKDKKGGNIEEFPPQFRVREFPCVQPMPV